MEFFAGTVFSALALFVAYKVGYVQFGKAEKANTGGSGGGKATPTELK